MNSAISHFISFFPLMIISNFDYFNPIHDYMDKLLKSARIIQLGNKYVCDLELIQVTRPDPSLIWKKNWVQFFRFHSIFRISTMQTKRFIFVMKIPQKSRFIQEIFGPNSGPAQLFGTRRLYFSQSTLKELTRLAVILV